MKKSILLSLTIFCFASINAQTVKKDTIQVQIAAVQTNVSGISPSSHGAPAVTFNGYIVLEQDKPNVYLDSRKVSISGYRILYANLRKWEDNNEQL